jgi:hypothetical protein
MVRPLAVVALLVSSMSFAAQPARLTAAHVRLFNGGPLDAAATLHCGAGQSTFTLAARGVADVPDAFLDGCRDAAGLAELSLERDGAIVALETRSTNDGEDAQRLLTSVHPAGTCPETLLVGAPLNGCKFGTATVATDSIPGAAYAWTVDGATVLSGAGTNILNLSLGSSASAAVSVDVTTGDCTVHGSAVIALHDPFAVQATVPAANAHQPLTITWSYTNGSPQTQTISGTDFGPVTLGAADRSYTYTPGLAGSKQFTIDAALQAPPTTSRHRVVGRGRTAASTCTTAHTTSTYDVGVCEPPQITLYAPPLLISGSTVNLAIAPVDGATATWTIRNGTPATGSGNLISVIAGAPGTLDITVDLVRAGCRSQLARTITVNDKPVCSNPKVTVNVTQTFCGSATIAATFTGTPPFTGTWSDGPAFLSYGVLLTRTVSSPGTYTIASFQDAACAGTVSGAAVVGALTPTATVVGKTDSCVGQDTYKLLLTGVPPFYLDFSDGTHLVTNSTEITRPVIAGLNRVYGVDATNCSIQQIGSMVGHPLPRIYLYTECLPPNYAYKMGVVAGVDGPEPNSATWSDGVTGVVRYLTPTQTQTLSLTSAGDAFCKVSFAPGEKAITVYADPAPDFHVAPELCSYVPNTVSLATPPPPGAQPIWTIDHGTILSGQITSTARYVATSFDATLTCTFTFTDPNRCPVATSVRGNFIGVTGTMSFPATVIHDHQTLHFTVTTGSQSWYVDDSMGDPITPSGTCTYTCDETYTSTHGRGTSEITLHFVDYCGNNRTTTQVITILP